MESNLVLEAEGNGEVHHGIFIRYETLHCHHVLLRILGERKGGGEGGGESERGGGEGRRKGERRREERRGGEREKEVTEGLKMHGTGKLPTSSSIVLQNLLASSCAIISAGLPIAS